MPEQLDLFPETIPETVPNKKEDLSLLTDDELRKRLAAALHIVNAGSDYDILVDTPTGEKVILDRKRIIPLIENSELADQERAHYIQKTIEERTSGPGGVD